LATLRRFTQEYQDQAVSLVLHPGRTIRDVAKSIGVHEITLGKWVGKARGGDLRCVPPATGPPEQCVGSCPLA
jgi:transposase-like protein